MVTTIKNKIIQAHSIIDEAFDSKQTSNYQLIIQIGTEGVLVTVNDKLKNKYIAFENFTFQNVYNIGIVADLMDSIIKDSKLINHKFKQVFCVIVNKLSTLVPNPLFEEDKKEMFLKFNTAMVAEEFVAVNNLKNIDTKNLFAIPKLLKSKLDLLFSNVSYFHASTLLIDSLLAQAKNQVHKKLFVHVQASHFEILLIEGKNLLFYNTFDYLTAEDFIYYVLFVCEQLALNPENIELTLLGEIERSSAIFSITQKYVRHLKMGERTEGSDYSFQLQLIQKHYYFTLFNNYIA